MSFINAGLQNAPEFSSVLSQRSASGLLQQFSSPMAGTRLDPWQRFRSTHHGAIASSFIHTSTRQTRIAAKNSSNQSFTPLDIPLNSNALFDLGVVDANQDGFFDVFTANHNAIQSLLLGNSSGTFTGTVSQWRLGHTQNFPGVEADRNFRPTSFDQGLHIYRKTQKTLSIRLQGSMPHPGHQPSKRIHGHIVFAAPDIEKPSITVREKHRAKLRVNERSLDQSFRITADFTIRANGYLNLDTRFIGLPYKFKLDKPSPLRNVHVGSQQLHPKNHTFTLYWRDRHGMAWTDYQGDGFMDVFMSRGGLCGHILDFPSCVSIQDQFFINQGNGRFRDRATGLGFEKQGCRTRKVEWVDFNQDNRLDLYASGKEESRNQLFQQQANGHFKNVAPKLGVDFDNTHLFEWLDADNDGDQDLLLARNQNLELYDNRSGRFKLRWQAPVPGNDPKKLAIADYDQDGDLDGYLASHHSNILLRNQSGRFAVTEPKTLGLPTYGLTANWVDYDNDGRLDLHVLPGQMYRQTANHHFVRTVLFQDQSVSKANAENARASWFDLDNNGTRDVLSVIRDPWPHTSLYLNALTQNHWLQVDLVGPQRNRQAIGARVVLETPDGKQLQEVGSAEGSHYSQGHYRLYFGLGQHETVESMKVIWGDGTKQTLDPPTADQRLTVRYTKN